MRFAAIAATVMATVGLASSPASSMGMMMCSDMSKMTMMMGTMPDGPKKWHMNDHLAMINAAMAKDGIRGCQMSMMHMMEEMHGSGMSKKKSGSHRLPVGSANHRH